MFISFLSHMIFNWLDEGIVQSCPFSLPRYDIWFIYSLKKMSNTSMDAMTRISIECQSIQSTFRLEIKPNNYVLWICTSAAHSNMQCK